MSGSISNSNIREGLEVGASPYYPPRARSWAATRQVWWKIARFLRLPLLQCFVPPSVSPGQFAVALVVPGLAFLAAGYRRTGFAAIAACVAALLTFVVDFGLPSAWAAASVLMTMHCIGLALQIEKAGLARRIIAVPVAFLSILAFVYFPLQMVVERYFLPLETPDGLVIVKRPAPELIKRGDRVAISVPARNEGQLRIKGGIGLETVLAGPGDVVEFSKDSFVVNGEPFPRLDHMPESGRNILAEDQWFIWPSFAVNNRGVAPATISGYYAEYSVVPRSRILGISCKRWFWHKTALP